MRSKINYQLETDRILAQLPAERTPTLFLHACCAPCSSYVLEYLSRYFAITLFFYIPTFRRRRSICTGKLSCAGWCRNYRWGIR